MTKKNYTKEDLVEFFRWNCNAPMKVVKAASVEELEKFLKDRGAYDRLLAGLDKQRYARELEKRSNAMWREIRRATK
jgi:hypothetical protein